MRHSHGGQKILKKENYIDLRKEFGTSSRRRPCLGNVTSF
jgi:hypothetical protein